MKNFFRILIFVVVLGSVSSGLLVAVNSYTAPRIARNEELRLKAAALDALDIPYTNEGLEKVFKEKVEIIKKGDLSFYCASDKAVAFEFHGPGLWGPISGIVSLERDLITIRRVRILHQEETPGLGARIAADEFLSQFKGKVLEPILVFVTKGKAKAKNEVDAITGATGSSKAFEKLLNESIKEKTALFNKG